MNSIWGNCEESVFSNCWRNCMSSGVVCPVCTLENISAKRESPFCLTILKVHGNEKDPSRMMIQLMQHSYFLIDV